MRIFIEAVRRSILGKVTAVERRLHRSAQACVKKASRLRAVSA